MRVFEHFEACHTPWGGGTLTRSMPRVAHPIPFRFDRYNESRGSRHSDARSDREYLTTDACEWLQCKCLSTLRLATHHGVVGHSPDRCGGSRTRRRYSPILYYLLSYYLYYLLAYTTYSPILLTRLYHLLSYTTYSPILPTRLYYLLAYTTYSLTTRRRAHRVGGRVKGRVFFSRTLSAQRVIPCERYTL